MSGQTGPRTYLGMLAEDFPNMMMVLGPHTARGNIPQAVEHSVELQTGRAAVHAGAQLHTD